MEQERKFYNVEELARLLGVSKNKVYDLCHIEGFPAIWLGRRVIVSRSGFEQWVESQAGSGVDILAR